ncbi:MAG: ankyrin repeat domain-containing protein [Nonlabens sp.]
MKNLITLAALLLCITFATAQTNLKSIFKNDDTTQLKDYLKNHNVNDCISASQSDYNLLSLAIKYDANKVFEALVSSKEIDLDNICEDKTPLMYAVKYGREKMFKKLLSKGADANKKSKRGRTAYEYALKHEQDSIAHILKELKR